MKTFLKAATLALGSTLLLAACSGGDGSGIATPPVGPIALEDRLGAAFGAIYRASLNSDPVEPSATTAIPVTLTEDPIPVP